MTTKTVTPKVARQEVSVLPPTLLTALRSEWTKLATVRSSWIALGLTAFVVALVSGVSGAFYGRATGQSALDFLTFSVYIVSLVGMIGAVIVGAIVGGSDLQRETSVPTLIAQPSRSKFLVAKMGFSLLAGIIAAGAMIGVGLLAVFLVAKLGLDQGTAGEVAGTQEQSDASLMSLIPKAMVHLGLGALFGTALGLITRQVTLAVSAFLVLRVVESVVLPASDHWLANLLPFAAGDRAFTASGLETEFARFESPTASLITFICFLTLLVAAGSARTFSEDVA